MALQGNGNQVSQSTRPKRVVVLMHGLWMTGAEMSYVRHRLKREGYGTRQFWYHSISRSLRQNTEALARFVEGIDAEEVHFVAHSFGGVLLYHYLQRYRDAGLRPGRAVALGSPFNGCWTARRVGKILPAMRWLTLGRSITKTMNASATGWNQPRDFGVIAGSRNIGLGTVLGGIPDNSDGTVGVEETRLRGATDHLVFKTNHFGLLASPTVAGQVTTFLREGQFAAAPAYNHNTVNA